MRFSCLLAATAALVLISGCATPVKTLPQLGDWEKKLVVHAGADSPTGGPFLTLDPNAPGSTEYAPPNANLGSGLSDMASSTTGQRPPVHEFKLRIPLAQNYYLNLSKPIVGTIWWTSTYARAGSALTYESEYGTLRAELWLGNQRVGGDQQMYTPAGAATPGGWRPLVVVFRPEVSLLSMGETLTLKVTRQAGLADLVFGTGGGHRSYLELRYFDFDPLAGTVYLENGKMVTAPNGAPEDPEAFLRRVEAFRASGGLAQATGDVVFLPAPRPAPPIAWAVPGLLPVLGLVALPAAHPRGRAGLAVLLLGALALSGCLSGTTGSPNGPALGDDAPRPTVSESFEDRPELKDQGIGEVRGLVVDAEVGVPLGNAHVSFLGTNLFTDTDKRGLFGFDAVPAGTYTMRVDAKNYQSIEEDVHVSAGKRTLVNVTLVRPGPQDLRAHRHDLFGDGHTYTVLQTTIRPVSSVAQLNAVPGGSYYCVSNAYECKTLLPIEPGIVVPPGTARLEVLFDWDASGNNPKEVGLNVQTSGNKTAGKYLPRGPRDAFNIAVFPNEADSGHQSFTFWVLEMVMRTQASTYHPTSAPPVYSGRDVSVSVVAHKGVVPFEPAHRRFWDGRTEITLVNDDKGAAYFACLTSLCPMPADAYSWNVNKGAFVPPGTKEIRGKLTWQTYNSLPTMVDWRLVYRAANVPPAKWDAYAKDAPKGASVGNGFEFVIPVAGEETDQFYQTTSNWKFYLDDGVDEVAAGVHPNEQGYGTRFFLAAVAVKDPHYAEL